VQALAMDRWRRKRIHELITRKARRKAGSWPHVQNNSLAVDHDRSIKSQVGTRRGNHKGGALAQESGGRSSLSWQMVRIAGRNDDLQKNPRVLYPRDVRIIGWQAHSSSSNPY